MPNTLPSRVTPDHFGYVFGIPGNTILLGRVALLAEDAALGRIEGGAHKVRRYGELLCRQELGEGREPRRRPHRGRSPRCRQPLHRHQSSDLPEALYEKIYCARGQAENLIKARKLHLASDHTACSRATANQFSLLIHTAPIGPC